MVEHRVDQRSIAVARARMNDETRGLIDNDKVVVNKYDFERDRLGLSRRRCRTRNVDDDFGAGGQTNARMNPVAADAYALMRKPMTYRRARVAERPRSQHPIETLCRFRLF